jgi:hypothetical protein
LKIKNVLCTASKNPQRQARSKLKVQSIFSKTKYYELFYLEHVRTRNDYILLTPELFVCNKLERSSTNNTNM